jgi:hypothetical protein
MNLAISGGFVGIILLLKNKKARVGLFKTLIVTENKPNI